MSNIDLPAYPVSEYDIHTFGHKTIDETAAFVKGLTKLEAFTRAAMQGLCANPALYETLGEFSPDGAALTIAHAARRIARATLAELEVKTP